MSVVTVLARAERPEINILQIETLYRNLGPFGAEAVLASGLDDLDRQMRTVADLSAGGPREPLHAALKTAAMIADQIGIAGIAQAARDAMACIEDADPVAEAATLSRLARLNNGTASALNALRDASG